MIQSALAVFLIVLGVGQLAVTMGGWRGLSLIGPSRWLGGGLGLALLAAGAVLLPPTWTVLGWVLPAVGLALVLLLLGGSFIQPPPHPDRLFEQHHPAHAHCQPVLIPAGEQPPMPGVLLRPPGFSPENSRPAVLIIPGAGDTKTNFKWRLVLALLAEGLTVLTIDPPGHGAYRQRPMAYPDCLSAVPDAVKFLRSQPGVTAVGLLGVSLGGALALKSLATPALWAASPGLVEALVVMATPTHLEFKRSLIYRVMWRTVFRAPVLSLFKEMSARQVRQSWLTGGYRSRHSTAEMFDLLDPLDSLSQLGSIPTLLVYSRRDAVSPPAMAQAMRQVAPWAALIEAPTASHITLILLPEINRRLARWLRNQLDLVQ